MTTCISFENSAKDAEFFNQTPLILFHFFENLFSVTPGKRACFTYAYSFNFFLDDTGLSSLTGPPPAPATVCSPLLILRPVLSSFDLCSQDTSIYVYFLYCIPL